MLKSCFGIPPHRRRAAAIVLVAVMVPVLLGFAVLTIDVGVLYNTRTDLQNAADAGALAATSILGSDQGAKSSFGEVGLARKTALSVIERHSTFGRKLTIDPTDIIFGRVDYDVDANTFSFTPTEKSANAVRIAVRSSSGSPNGPVPLFFASIFGKSTANVEARATAALTGLRDIAVTIDLSGSMKYDSDLRWYDKTPINLRDIWASLDGPEPSRPYVPGNENETEYASDTGPTIGAMSVWGNTLTPSSGKYDPTKDPGLWHIPDNKACTLAAVTASLTARGYNASRRNTIMNSSTSSTWPNRVAVMVGLAEWTPKNSSDTSVSNNELKWIPYPSYRKNWTWSDYIDWSAGNDNSLSSDHSAFKFRFGLKTYVEFLLDRVDSFSQTNLTKPPLEPLRSVKDGLQEMVNESRSSDQISLEVFASTAHHEVDLSDNRQAVADRLYQMQPNYYDSNTNIGAGLQAAIAELTSVRARDRAEKIVVLMSDGASNTGPSPTAVAQTAADQGIKIYSISVGYGADRPTMKKIAEMTGGEEFYAQGNPEEYTALLLSIFRKIAGLGSPVLIE